MCDALAPCCLRLAPRCSLHTTLFLTLREEAGDAWASEVQHNEEYAHTATKSHTCTETLTVCTPAFVTCQQTPGRHTHFSPRHPSSTQLTLAHMTTHSDMDGLSYLDPHPSPLWCSLSLLTQIWWVALGQWVANGLILITVNSTMLRNVCMNLNFHACIHAYGATEQS